MGDACKGGWAATADGGQSRAPHDGTIELEVFRGRSLRCSHPGCVDCSSVLRSTAARRSDVRCPRPGRSSGKERRGERRSGLRSEREPSWLLKRGALVSPARAPRVRSVPGLGGSIAGILRTSLISTGSTPAIPERTSLDRAASRCETEWGEVSRKAVWSARSETLADRRWRADSSGRQVGRGRRLRSCFR
jgi:hypothetical protein